MPSISPDDANRSELAADRARQSLTIMAISVTGFFLVFFPLAPDLGFSVLADDVWRVPQIVLPVFVGYLAAAIYFVFGQTEPTSIRPRTEKLLNILLYGPFIVFVLGTVALLFRFRASHSAGATPNTGMTVETLATGFSVLLSLLTGTTTFISQFLFGARESNAGKIQGPVVP
jgi:hypothetical protein